MSLQLSSEKDTDRDIEASLAELEELCLACDVEVLATSVQKRTGLDAATAAGKGKIEELGELAKNLEANTLVFDGELSGSQMSNISDISGLKVLDRTMLILDIFARRAKSAEGVLQVEIAQLQDRLTRLSGSGSALSRLGGGIGTRGPGETQLETDRRHIQRRITHLKRKLKDLSKRRDLIREQRGERDAINIAVCGYTNAGKSSLINSLCKTELEAFNQVFATLDPRARRLPVDGPEILLSDTVGFIRKLPHELVEAFKSTLDEIRHADMLIQVTDISDPDAQAQSYVVDEMLSDLDSADKPRLHVLNKIDNLNQGEEAAHIFRNRHDEHIKEYFVSVKEGTGMAALKQGLLDMISEDWLDQEELLDHSKQAKLDQIRNNAWIEKLDYRDDGIYVKYKAPPAFVGRIASN